MIFRSVSVLFMKEAAGRIMKNAASGGILTLFCHGGYAGGAALSCAGCAWLGREILWRGGERDGGCHYIGEVLRAGLLTGKLRSGRLSYVAESADGV